MCETFFFSFILKVSMRLHVEININCAYIQRTALILCCIQKMWKNHLEFSAHFFFSLVWELSLVDLLQMMCHLFAIWRSKRNRGAYWRFQTFFFCAKYNGRKWTGNVHVIFAIKFWPDAHTHTRPYLTQNSCYFSTLPWSWINHDRLFQGNERNVLVICLFFFVVAVYILFFAFCFESKLSTYYKMRNHIQNTSHPTYIYPEFNGLIGGSKN